MDNGDLAYLSHIECGGRTPRNFSFDLTGRYILAGNQDSDNITVFRITQNGRPDPVNKTDIGSPVCIRFFRNN